MSGPRLRLGFGLGGRSLWYVSWQQQRKEITNKIPCRGVKFLLQVVWGIEGKMGVNSRILEEKKLTE